MAVIPSTQVELCRHRRQLQSAVQDGDWQRVVTLDKSLMDGVSIASDDEQRDLDSLIREMQQVVSLYRDIVARCESEAQYLAKGLLS